MCAFCDIATKKGTAFIVHENENLVAFLDLDPIHEGHVLIIPKMHVDSIDLIPDEILLDIMKIAKKIVVAMRWIYGNKGYSIMQNGGKYCDFGHAHFHVFPRYDKDGFGWTYPNKKSDCSEKIAENIRKHLNI